MTDKAPMTVEGEKALRAEHEHLTKNVRIKLSKEIAAARELGDLKENAEYHAAKEKQSFIEGRITELESVLSRAEIIDLSKIKVKKIKSKKISIINKVCRFLSVNLTNPSFMKVKKVTIPIKIHNIEDKIIQ